ncbi:phytoene desaturase family protein [Streptosporangium sp. NPDC000396]|uniref:phytoene desaturase family protein n=1 Tax=Streptosporangium sp. NPDC000396 TaxID=3366185 RepID=UPI0036A5963C
MGTTMGNGHNGEWDAIVVGAGFGGLVCAAYLAVGGLRVLVLEQGDIAGGNSHVFRRRRSYEFDVGVHYVGDAGSGGVLSAILSGLGIGDRAGFEQMDRNGFDRIILPSLTVEVPADWSAYRERLKQALPEEQAGIDAFIDVLVAVSSEQRSILLATEDLSPATLAAGAQTLLRWGSKSLTDLFDHCGLSPRARTVLAAQTPNYGLAPENASVTIHSSMIDQFMRGAYYPRGGSQVPVASMVEVIEAHGGELRTRARVRRILIEDRRVTGVALADDSVITAPLVVSNADYRRTILELAGAEHFNKSLVAKTRDAEMARPFPAVYIGLDRELPEWSNANVWWYRDEDIEESYRRVATGDVDDVPFLFVSVASTKDPGSRWSCPPGHTNIQLLTTCPPGYDRWGVDSGPADGGAYRRNPSYQAGKARLTEAVLSVAERILGPLREHIVHLETATPLSQERYTLSSGGTPYGLARWGAKGSRPDVRTSVEGLYVVGQNTRYGSGITGVSLGGITCAGQILGRRLLGEAHAGAVLGDPALLPDRPGDWDPLAVSRGAARAGRRGPDRIHA